MVNGKLHHVEYYKKKTKFNFMTLYVDKKKDTSKKKTYPFFCNSNKKLYFIRPITK